MYLRVARKISYVHKSLSVLETKAFLHVVECGAIYIANTIYYSHFIDRNICQGGTLFHSTYDVIHIQDVSHAKYLPDSMASSGNHLYYVVLT